jgi:hypothetical protein
MELTEKASLVMAAAVVAQIPAGIGVGLGNALRHELLGTLVVVENAPGRRIWGRDGEPVVGGGRSGRRQQWCMTACVLAREMREMAFYRRGASWRGGNADV